MTCRMADDFFLTSIPWLVTSDGSCAWASWTRFCTSTVLMSGSVPTWKVMTSL
jgi:hypothetical protein